MSRFHFSTIRKIIFLWVEECKRLLNEAALRQKSLKAPRSIKWVITLRRRYDDPTSPAYATNADAVAAKERLGQKPGFVDTPEGFEIHEYQLNQDHWTEGYVRV